MDYKEFCEHIKDEIKGFLPEQYASYDTQLHTVSKPNVGEQVGLTFVPPISGTPAPVIYLEPYYDAYLNRGMSVGRLMTQIADTAAKGIERGRSGAGGILGLVPDMADWEKVKDKVTVRVIGVSRNTELLKDVPCRLFGDIALIYQVSVKAPDDTLMTVRITNNLMEQYGISEPQLYDTAMENSQRLQKVTCRPMGEVIGDLLGPMDDPIIDEAPAKLYVLSNESLQFGAAALFYPGVIEKIGKSIPEGFYILPSSIHEVLILPKNQGEKAMLENMVQEINETQVAPDEVLSDFVSEYDARTRTMEWGRNPNLTLPEQLKDKTPERTPMLPKDVIL